MRSSWCIGWQLHHSRHASTGDISLRSLSYRACTGHPVRCLDRFTWLLDSHCRGLASMGHLATHTPGDHHEQSCYVHHSPGPSSSVLSPCHIILCPCRPSLRLSVLATFLFLPACLASFRFSSISPLALSSLLHPHLTILLTVVTMTAHVPDRPPSTTSSVSAINAAVLAFQKERTTTSNTTTSCIKEN